MRADSQGITPEHLRNIGNLPSFTSPKSLPKPSKLDEILETLSPEIKVNPKFSHPDKPKYGQRRAEARAQILALMLELIEEAMHVETYGLLDKKTLIDSVEAL